MATSSSTTSTSCRSCGLEIGDLWPELARAVWYPGLSAELREDVFASVPDPLELGLKRVTDAVSSSVPLGIGSSYSGSCTFGVRD